MRDNFTEQDLRQLLGRRDTLCVSIYLPTQTAGPEIEQNPIQLKNLLNEAEEKLVQGGVRAAEAREWLEKARSYLDDRYFWQHQSHGLALFIEGATTRLYRLPLEFKPEVVVSDRFHITPLLPLLSGDGLFYLLALSQKQARLFQGSRFEIEEVPVEEMPKSLADALRYDEFEPQTQYHSADAPGAAGGGQIIFHGHGGGEEDRKVHLARYLQGIDRALAEVLQKEQAPLVLAGVDYLLGIYREVNTYDHLLEEAILGNPDDLSAQELHQRAWPLVEPVFRAPRQEAAERYKALAGTGKTANDIQEIVPAAYQGRIDVLFLTREHHVWGTFDVESQRVHLDEAPGPDNEDLCDLAAAHTFLNRGKVYVVDPDQEPDAMPDTNGLAAIFRY
ncbi:MAG: hypothetical protein KatS3mg050_2119 [Litorilinea sp.]|nr:MAG: hypothetical protein KatS3mg050_2119 [Litorilinea sp.]